MVPEDLAAWRLHRIGIRDDSIVVAKRTPIAIVFRPTLRHGWWEVTKFRGGQVLARENLRLEAHHARLLRAVP